MKGKDSLQYQTPTGPEAEFQPGSMRDYRPLADFFADAIERGRK